MKKPKRMPKAQRGRLKVGDWIKVRTWTRDGYFTIVRKIVYRGEMGIGIRFNGCNPFYLYSKSDVIIEKVKR